jgi:subtilisin family serine protease
MKFEDVARARRVSGWLAGVLCTAIAGIATADPVRPVPDGPLNPSHIPRLEPARVDPAVQRPYIVAFAEPALASYRGADGRFRAPNRRANGKLDVAGADSQAYAAHLRAMQSQHLAAAAAAIGRNLAPSDRFPTALSAVGVRMIANVGAKLRNVAGVALVEASVDMPVDSDTGPAFTGAPGIWSGADVPSALGTKGVGVVIAVLDSGINFGSPSFAAIEPGNAGTPGGYAHVDPAGAGTFLGSCAGGGADAGQCNAKLYGAYDFVYAQVCTPAQPATDPCRPAVSGGTIREEPGASDNDGHGSHVASIAAGNAAVAPYRGISVAVSGVAPHANLIAYDACYTRVVDDVAVCPSASLVAAINQAITDGVDVISYPSGSPSTDPWTDSTSLALLAAQNAGIVVSSAAGNNGPTTGSLDHREPWVLSVGASTHNREFGFRFDLTAPANGPANTQNLTVYPGGDPVATTTVSAPLIVSPSFATPNSDGCSPYPANTFRRPATSGGTSGIAVLALNAIGSQCGTINRRAAALSAGAIAVLFVVDQQIELLASDTTYEMLQPAWANVLAHMNTAPDTATATIAAPLARRLTAQGDVVMGFSSRGPTSFDVLKPDLTAPGANILAAVDGASSAYAQMSGTSMAAGHLSGAAALLRALYPTWTPTEIRSALTTTAKSTGLIDNNNGLPADGFVRGAGRVDLSVAAEAGLVLDESAAHYTDANPASGGDPKTLNLPSYQNDLCVATCSFTRVVRNTRATAATYTLGAVDLPANAASFNPPSFTINGGATQTITVMIDSSKLANKWNHGAVTLTPSGGGLPELHLPVAVYPAPPDIFVSTNSVSVTLPPNNTTTRQVTISNVGNPQLNWKIVGGTAPAPGGGTIDCAQPAWLSYDIVSGALRTNEQSVVTLLIDTTGVAPGTYNRTMCISTQSTDPDEEYVFVTLSLTLPNVPSGIGSATPAAVFFGGSTLLRVELAPATAPASTGVTMTADLTAIGGAAAQPLYDDGTHGDVTAADGIFSFDATVPMAATAGAYVIPVTIVDAQARTGAAQIAVRVMDPNMPNGVPTIAPAVASTGASVLLTLAVTPATTPPSTGILAYVTLTQIGGAAGTPMYDDGTHGDVTAGDKTYSLLATVGAATPAGVRTLTFTVTDVQARTTTATATLKVAADAIFKDGYE